MDIFTKEFIIALILLIVLAIIIFYIYIARQDKKKNGSNKKLKSMSDASIKNLEEKKNKNKEILEKKGFKIFRELISPVEPVYGNDSIKVVAIDFTEFNMAVTHISTSSDLVLPKIYDIRNIIDVKLIINDELDSEEKIYEDGITSIKLDIRAKDSMNPKYFIGLLPKTVASPNRKFEQDYIDYSRAILKELNKVVMKNTK